MDMAGQGWVGATLQGYGCRNWREGDVTGYRSRNSEKTAIWRFPKSWGSLQIIHFRLGSSGFSTEKTIQLLGVSPWKTPYGGYSMEILECDEIRKGPPPPPPGSVPISVGEGCGRSGEASSGGSNIIACFTGYETWACPKRGLVPFGKLTRTIKITLFYM